MSDLSPFDLKRMDEAEARERLSDDEFERWQQVRKIVRGGEATRQEWRAQAETVADVIIRDDMREMEATVDIFDNDIRCRAVPDDAFRGKVEEFRERYGDVADIPDDADPAEALGEDVFDETASFMVDLFALLVQSFNGTDLRDVPTNHRRLVALDCLDAWELDGLTACVMRMVVALHKQNEEVMGDIDSFRGEGWPIAR